MDTVETFIYDSDVRIKSVRLSQSLEKLFEAQTFPKKTSFFFQKRLCFRRRLPRKKKMTTVRFSFRLKTPPQKRRSPLFAKRTADFAGHPTNIRKTALTKRCLPSEESSFPAATIRVPLWERISKPRQRNIFLQAVRQRQKRRSPTEKPLCSRNIFRVTM